MVEEWLIICGSGVVTLINNLVVALICDLEGITSICSDNDELCH